MEVANNNVEDERICPPFGQAAEVAKVLVRLMTFAFTALVPRTFM